MMLCQKSDCGQCITSYYRLEARKRIIQFTVRGRKVPDRKRKTEIPKSEVFFGQEFHRVIHEIRDFRERPMGCADIRPIIQLMVTARIRSRTCPRYRLKCQEGRTDFGIPADGSHSRATSKRGASFPARRSYMTGAEQASHLPRVLHWPVDFRADSP